MPAPRPPSWLLLALALGGPAPLVRRSDADEGPLRPAPPRPVASEPAAGRVPGSREAPGPHGEAVTIPFAHRVGDRWRLRFECEEQAPGAPVALWVEEAEAQVLSPLGRDLLVELRWTHVVRDGAALSLWPRREASAHALDAKGGGRLLLRVDLLGSALAVTNHEEALVALERVHGARLADEAAAEHLDALTREWNVAYGACGVPLVPSAPRVSALAGAETAGNAADERVLLPEGPEPGRPVAWSVRSTTSAAGATESEPSLRLTASTRFDLASRRLSGWQLSVRVQAQRRSVTRIAFAELDAEAHAADAPLALAR